MKEGYCKEEVCPNDRWGAFHPHQCRRKIWKDGYCKQHHPDSAKKRAEEQAKRYEEKKKESPFYIIKSLQEKIQMLEEQIKRMGARDKK